MQKKAEELSKNQNVSRKRTLDWRGKSNWQIFEQIWVHFLINLKNLSANFRPKRDFWHLTLTDFHNFQTKKWFQNQILTILKVLFWPESKFGPQIWSTFQNWLLKRAKSKEFSANLILREIILHTNFCNFYALAKVPWNRRF